VHIAREAGFANVNVDLMFGLPQQSLQMALADLSTALDLQPEHISWYQLTLEPGTAFFKQPPVLPDDDATWEIQQRGLEMLDAAGLSRYEVSAYARSGARCRHNLNYWTFGDYLGIGAGAHGKITDAESDRVIRTAKAKNPEAYMGMRRDGTDRDSVWDIAPDERPLEFLMNHLRLRDGFAESCFPLRTGLAVDALEPALSDCVRDGLLEHQQGVVRCSDRGWQFLVDVLGRFVH
jgi:oxygen-independent coproporphyrinogen-3 oxidase